MSIHAERAVGIAEAIGRREVAARTAERSARQGDLVLRRVGPLVAVRAHDATPPGGVVLAAGSHGEHRILGRVAVDVAARTVEVVDAVVVHTDEPSGRHGAIRLAPGTWRYDIQREIGLGDVIEQVRD